MGVFTLSFTVLKILRFVQVRIKASREAAAKMFAEQPHPHEDEPKPNGDAPESTESLNEQIARLKDELELERQKHHRHRRMVKEGVHTRAPMHEHARTRM